MVFFGDNRENERKRVADGLFFGWKHSAHGFFNEQWMIGGREHNKGGGLGRQW